MPKIKFQDWTVIEVNKIPTPEQAKAIYKQIQDKRGMSKTIAPKKDFTKSEFYTEGGTIRGQTEAEKRYTSKTWALNLDTYTGQKNKMFENPLEQAVKAPIRWLAELGTSLAEGAIGLSADVIGGDYAENARKKIEENRFKNDPFSEKKWFFDSIGTGDPAQVLEALSGWVGSIATGWVQWKVARSISWGLRALFQGGNMSTEWENQGQNSSMDKVIAYWTSILSAGLDTAASWKVVDGLMKKGVDVKIAKTFVQKMNNYLKTLNPSTFEAGQEVVQQKLENIGRDLMGVKYEEGLKQYFEAGVLGKILGKLGDPGYQEGIKREWLDYPEQVWPNNTTDDGWPNAVWPSWLRFALEDTPSMFSSGWDTIFSSKNNEDLATRSVFPKMTKEKGTAQKVTAGQTALKGIEQMYEDNRSGVTNADISTMEGWAESIEQGLEHYGKIIGENTDSNNVVQINDDMAKLADALEDPTTQYRGPLLSIAEDILRLFWNDKYGNGMSIRDMQAHLSTIKSKIFSNHENVKALYGEASGRAVREFLDVVSEKFDKAIENSTGDLPALQKARKAYSSYKKIQKDFVSSMLLDKRNVKWWALSKAGSVVGIYELLKNPTLSGIATSIIVKSFLTQMWHAKSRGGSFETLIRNLDRDSLKRAKWKLPLNQPTDGNSDMNTGTDNNGVAGKGPVQVEPIVNATPWTSLAAAFERGYTLKNGRIDKEFWIKEALADFKKLPFEEQAKAVEASPALARVVEIDEVLTGLPEPLFGAKVSPQEIVKDLRPITEKIINKEYSPEELKFISETAPKEAQLELKRAYEKTTQTGYKTAAETTEPVAKTSQELVQDELRQLSKIATAASGSKSMAVTDMFYRDFTSGRKDMNEIFDLMDANDSNVDDLARRQIIEGYERFTRKLEMEKVGINDDGTADLSKQRLPEKKDNTPSEPYTDEKMEREKKAKEYVSHAQAERDSLMELWLSRRQAENAIREYNTGFDDPDLLEGKLEMIGKSLKNNGVNKEKIATILDNLKNTGEQKKILDEVLASNREKKTPKQMPLKDPKELPPMPKDEPVKSKTPQEGKTGVKVVKTQQPTEFKIVEDKWLYNLMQKNPTTGKWELSLWNFAQPEEAAKFVPKSATLLEEPKPSLPLSQKSEVKYSEALSKVDKKNLDVENMSGIWETLPTNYAGKKIDIQKDLTDIDWLETKLLEKNITWVSSGALSKFVEPHPYFKSSYKIADIDGKWYLFLKKWVDFNSLPKQAKFDITTALNKEFYITNDWWKTWKSYSYK